MYGRTRAEREWMADVAAQMIRDELLDEEDDWELESNKEPTQVECPSCGGFGFVTIGNEDEPDCDECSTEFTCDDCSGTGLVDED